VKGALYELSKSQLANGTAHLTPAITVTSDDVNPGNPVFVTFDGAGNAGVDNETDSKIVEFTARQLRSGGSQQAKWS
jgi:hypothetical protein